MTTKYTGTITNIGNLEQHTPKFATAPVALQGDNGEIFQLAVASWNYSNGMIGINQRYEVETESTMRQDGTYWPPLIKKATAVASGVVASSPLVQTAQAMGAVVSTVMDMPTGYTSQPMDAPAEQVQQQVQPQVQPQQQPTVNQQPTVGNAVLQQQAQAEPANEPADRPRPDLNTRFKEWQINSRSAHDKAIIRTEQVVQLILGGKLVNDQGVVIDSMKIENLTSLYSQFIDQYFSEMEIRNSFDSFGSI